MIATSYLKRFKFFKAGEILVRNQSEIYYRSADIEIDSIAGVYLWIARNHNNDLGVIYAGKAGYGIHKRINQHIAGYKRVPEKSALVASIAEKCKSAAIEVWFRTSPSCQVDLGSGEVSMYSIEEETLIRKFSPRLNRQLPPNS